jgi:hypothetical protein
MGETTPLLTREEFLLNKTSKTKEKKTLFERVLTSCNTKWFKTSWWGILLYVGICCLNYIIGYYGIYRPLEWHTPIHNGIRVFGDLVTVAWFALGIVALPWHQWEQLTWIKTRDWKGVARFLAWWSGTIITFFIYGYMGENPFFQTSLASNLTPGQKAVCAIVFAVIAAIVVYWFAKLCPCGKKIKNICDPELSRKIIFIRLFMLLASLFTISYLLCVGTNGCTYHLHHWWFGFVLIMLSTASLDNWFDYFLQGIFWTFLIVSIFNYGLVFGEFFI